MSETLKDLLKPCPLCGGEAEIQFSYYFRYARIFCKKCGLSTLDLKGDDDGKKRLIELWNNRVNDPKWIPIEQQEPSEFELVLCCILGEKENAIEILYRHGDSYYSDYDGGIIYSQNEISHWMPLPEPPKGK